MSTFLGTGPRNRGHALFWCPCNECRDERQRNYVSLWFRAEDDMPRAQAALLIERRR